MKTKRYKIREKDIERDYDLGDKIVTVVDNEKLAALLLLEGVLEVLYSEEGSNATLCVDCSDAFVWASADAEPVKVEELSEVWRMWQEDEVWGPFKWVCNKRNEQPMGPWIDWMEEAGVDTSDIKSLPENGYDAYLRKKENRDTRDVLKSIQDNRDENSR